MSRDPTSDLGSGSAARQGGWFPPTRWSVVLEARSDDAAAAAAGLAEWCRIYWPPVYSFLRRRGNSPQDAEDLTQGFFAMLLERNSLAVVDEAKGRLRSFLLVALKRFAAGQYARDCAQRRGGGVVHVPIDADQAEERYAAEPATNVTPDLLFERQWAMTLLEQVLELLRAEYARDGRERVFDALKNRISADGEPDNLATVAQEMGMNVGAVKVAIHRLRLRYRKMLREQIARTVESPEEVEDEISHLLRIFSAAG